MHIQYESLFMIRAVGNMLSRSNNFLIQVFEGRVHESVFFFGGP